MSQSQRYLHLVSREAQVQDLLDSVVRVVEDAQVLAEIFCESLFEEREKLHLTESTLWILFRNIHEVADLLHTQWFAPLHFLREKSTDFEKMRLGAVFHNSAALWNAMNTYATGLFESHHLATELLEKNPAFKEFVRECMLNPACLSRPRDLNELIRLPIENTKVFMNNLREVVGLTNERHPDFQDLVKARDEVGMAVLTINEIEEKSREDDEGNQRNLMILSQRVVIPERWSLNLIKNARRFVRTGRVFHVESHGKKMKRGDERTILLFNDLMLVAELKTKKSEELYFLKDWGNMIQLQCFDRADDSGVSHLFEIVGLENEKSFVVACDDAETKRVWLREIRAQTDHFKEVGLRNQREDYMKRAESRKKALEQSKELSIKTKASSPAKTSNHSSPPKSAPTSPEKDILIGKKGSTPKFDAVIDEFSAQLPGSAPGLPDGDFEDDDDSSLMDLPDELPPVDLQILGSPRFDQPTVWSIVRQFLAREIEYVDDLNILVQGFRDPFEEQGVLPSHEISLLFGNAREIKDIQHDFVVKVKTWLKEYEPSDKNSEPKNKEESTEEKEERVEKERAHLFAAIKNLLSLFTSFSVQLDKYTPYCSNNQAAMARFDDLDESDAKFKKLLQAFSTDIGKTTHRTGTIDLRKLLTAPPKHLGHYEEFLMTLARGLKTTGEDPSSVEAVRSIMVKAVDKIRLAIDDVHDKILADRDKVDYIGKRLFESEDAKEPMGDALFVAGRKLVKTTDAKHLSGKKFKKEQEVTLFLFNDLLLVTTLRSKKGATDRNYTLLFQHNMRDIAADKHDDEYATDSIELSIVESDSILAAAVSKGTRSPRSKEKVTTVMLEFSTTETRDQWLVLLNDLTKSFIAQRQRRGKTMDTLQEIDPALALLSPRVQMQKGIDDSEDADSRTLTKADANAMEKMKKNKRKAIEQLLADQETYVGDLSVLLEVFKSQLEESLVVGDEYIDAIFGNIPDVFKAHTHFMKLLKDFEDSADDGDADIADLNWGQLLSRHWRPINAAYVAMSPLDSVKALITRLAKENEKFASYLTSSMGQPRAKLIPVTKYLEKAHARVESLAETVNKILSFTPSDSKLYDDMKAARGIFADIVSNVKTAFLDAKAKEGSEQSAVRDISSSLEKEIELAVVGRRVLKSGDLTQRSGKKYEKQETVVVHMLTDLLIVLSAKKKGFELVSQINLLDLTIESVTRASAEDLLLVDFKFGKESLVIAFANAVARIEWVEAIGNQQIRLKPRSAKERAAEALAKSQAKDAADREKARLESTFKPAIVPGSAPATSGDNMDTDKKTRENILNELMDTEAEYLKDMKMMIKNFQDPLEERGLLTANEVFVLFGNLDELTELNETQLLEPLQKRKAELTEAKAPLYQMEVADILAAFTEKVTAYEAYCANQSYSTKLLEELIQANGEFAWWHNATKEKPEMKGLGLQAFVIKPLQRICKYPLLFKELSRFTPEKHPDFANLKKVTMAIEDCVIKVNEQKRLNDEDEERNWAKLKEIQAKIKVLMQLKDEPRFDLMKYGRKFVKLGNFMHVTGKKHDKVREVTMFLFNDLLVLATPHKKDLYIYERTIHHKDLRVFDFGAVGAATHAIQLEKGDLAGESILLNTRHAESKAKWLDTLRRVTSDYQQQKFRRVNFDKAKYGRRKQIKSMRFESSLKSSDTSTTDGATIKKSTSSSTVSPPKMAKSTSDKDVPSAGDSSARKKKMEDIAEGNEKRTEKPKSPPRSPPKSPPKSPREDGISPSSSRRQMRRLNTTQAVKASDRDDDPKPASPQGRRGSNEKADLQVHRTQWSPRREGPEGSTGGLLRGSSSNTVLNAVLQRNSQTSPRGVNGVSPRAVSPRSEAPATPKSSEPLASPKSTTKGEEQAPPKLALPKLDLAPKADAAQEESKSKSESSEVEIVSPRTKAAKDLEKKEQKEREKAVKEKERKERKERREKKELERQNKPSLDSLLSPRHESDKKSKDSRKEPKKDSKSSDKKMKEEPKKPATKEELAAMLHAQMSIKQAHPQEEKKEKSESSSDSPPVSPRRGAMKGSNKGAPEGPQSQVSKPLTKEEMQVIVSSPRRGGGKDKK